MRCCVVRLRVRELRDLPGVDQFFMVRLRLRYRRAAAASGVDMAVCLVILMLAPVVTVVGYEMRGYRHQAEAVAIQDGSVRGRSPCAPYRARQEGTDFKICPRIQEPPSAENKSVPGFVNQRRCRKKSVSRRPHSPASTPPSTWTR